VTLDRCVTLCVDDETLIVAFTGELDLLSSTQTWEQVERVVDAEPTRLVLDLSGLSFIDASGLGIIAAVHQRVASYGGVLLVRDATPAVRRAMAATGLDVLLPAAREPGGPGRRR
jgi:anti-anti-sigma factor